MTKLHERTLATPIGELLLVASDVGLRAVLWPGEDGSRLRRALSHGADARGPDTTGPDPREVLADAQGQLDAYFAGDLQEFDLPLDLVGTPFQLAAWRALREIPYGRTSSYAAQAVAIGRPTAVRAVGAANRANPVSIVVPCHRVVASSGSLTGFAGGLTTKAWLLAMEASHCRQPVSP